MMDKLEDCLRFEQPHEPSKVVTLLSCKQTLPTGSSKQASQHTELPNCSQMSSSVIQDQELKCEDEHTNDHNVIAECHGIDISNIKIEHTFEIGANLKTSQIAHGGLQMTNDGLQCSHVFQEQLERNLVGSFFIPTNCPCIFYNWIPL